MAINTTVENINNQPTIKPRTVTGIFTRYIAKTIPLAFDESMSYYECLCALLEYLNETIVPDINNVNDGLGELQGFYEELQSYVNNYFDNLDVQEEINNKLDEMAESGQLTDIIAQYLGLAGMFVFNTVADMKLAENLVNGSKCQTLGYYSIDDDGKALYLIRTITNEDVVDESTIIALHDNTLVAELITINYNLKQLGCKGDGTTDDTNKLKHILEDLVDDGDVIFVPKGTYTYTGTITCTKAIKITGAYSHKYLYQVCTIKNNGTGGLVFTAGNVIIENIDFVGNTESTSFALKMLGGRPNIINCCINHFDNSTGLFIGEDSAYHNTDLFVLENIIVNYCDIGIHMGSAFATGTTLVDNNAGTASNINISNCRIGLDIKNSNSNNFLSFEVDNCSEYGIKFTNASRNFFVNPYMECNKNMYFDTDSNCNKIIGSRGSGWISQNEGNVDNNMILGNSQGKGVYDLYQYLRTQTLKVAKEGENGWFDFDHTAHTLSVKHSQLGGVIDLSNSTYKQTTKVDKLLITSTMPITNVAHSLGALNNVTIPANGIYQVNVVNANITKNDFSGNTYNLWHPNITFDTDVPNGVIATVEARNGMFTLKLLNTTGTDISYTSRYTIAAIKVYAE